MIGDSHVPDRARELPSQLKTRLTEVGKFDAVLFTGDVVRSREVPRLLEGLAKSRKEVFLVQGNMDAFAGVDLPEFQLVDLALDVSAALFHGHQVHRRGDHRLLLAHADKFDAQLVVTGHTHAHDVHLDEKSGRLLLNPGSCTGAWSFVATGTPSFVVVALDDAGGGELVLEVKLERLVGGRWSAEKWLFRVAGGRVHPFR